MFKQVILNLFDNAIKYSYSDSFVKIYGLRTRLCTELTVQNLGIEIPTEEEEKIFERFYRTKRAISISPTGSGIGLIIVKDFAEKHGVRTEVKSVPLKGKGGPYLNSFSLNFLNRKLYGKKNIDHRR